jgi:hypothetical protein
VFSVRSGGATGTMVRGFDPRHAVTFRQEGATAGPVITIKLSPDMRCLAIQRNANEVQLTEVPAPVQPNTSSAASSSAGGPPVTLGPAHFTQALRAGRSAVLLGFSWLQREGATDMALVSDHGLELYALASDRRSLRFLRAFNQAVGWYSLCPRSGVLVFAPPSDGNDGGHGSHWLQVCSIRGTYIYKLQRIDLEEPVRDGRDVAVLELYGKTYVAVAVRNGESAEVHLHWVPSDGSAIVKAFVLRLPPVASSSSAGASSAVSETENEGRSDSGTISLNCVDDLLLVHRPLAASTLVFDICSLCETDGSINYLQPAAVASFSEALASFTGYASTGGDKPSSKGSYPANWVFFMPDVVVDAKFVSSNAG